MFLIVVYEAVCGVCDGFQLTVCLCNIGGVQCLYIFCNIFANFPKGMVKLYWLFCALGELLC